MYITAEDKDGDFSNRVNIHYEWENGETGRFTVNRFQNHTLQETETIYFKEAIELALKWSKEYKIEIWSYGEWIHDRVKEKFNTEIKWY
jgi:hypothetical protein